MILRYWFSSKPTGMRPLRRPRRRREDNIRIDINNIGVNTRNSIDSNLDRDYWGTLMNSALNIWVS